MAAGTAAESQPIRYQTRPSPETLAGLGVAEGLGKDFAYAADAFRATLVGMARAPGAELTVAIVEEQIVGFVFLSLPHPQGWWGRRALEGIYEVAALEVARPWRGNGIGTALLRTALGPHWDERILLASLDPEEWDTLGSGRSRSAYRRMLLSLFRRAGFAEYPLALEPGLSHDPASLFLVRVGARVERERLRQFGAVLEGGERRSLGQINRLPREEREAIYRRLIPHGIFAAFAIDPPTFTDAAGNRLVEFDCPPDHEMVWIGVRGRPEDGDLCFLLKLQGSASRNLELAFVVISDPRAERFGVDRDPEGGETRLGTAGRNVLEEIRAMQAGLAPGQTRRGLRLLREAVRLVEEFVAWMGGDRVFLHAMFYHNAILYERYGFGYAAGREEMERIHQEFQPGGTLFALLDGSTPFRRPGAERSVRGRSWAIHDGILGGPWQPPRMVKRVGKDEGICTFPDALW
ncbi:MAG TPA: GNAT family N-acetyltransferase [Candidatus Methylomirabilis sp.]|nr:GNAT family N-acetyltransferase [Candidatus Methylomirabilis sp.]